MTRPTHAVSRFAGAAGVIAASGAALCCAGAPVILSVLAATGLGFLRRDAILLPIIGVALLVALWGFWMGRRVHGSWGPFAVSVIGSIALVAGVVFIHGFPAKVMIGAGALILLGATLWNARLPRACDEPVQLQRTT
jgi:MerC mercury resistance protein.